jgi:hypothetical protein
MKSINNQTTNTMSEIQKLQAINDWLNDETNTSRRLLKLRELSDDWQYVSEERWQTFLVDVEEVLYYIRVQAKIQLRDAIHSADPKMKRVIVGKDPI